MRLAHGDVAVYVPGFHPLLTLRIWRWLRRLNTPSGRELLKREARSRGWTVTEREV